MPDTPETAALKSKSLRRRGKARVVAILDAATEIFLQHGYEKATISQIVECSGGSKSLVYEQFGGKSGLFQAMMETRCASMMEPLSAISADSDPPRAILTKFARAFVDALSDPEVLGLQRVASAEGFRNPEIADIFFSCGHDMAYDHLTNYLVTISDPSIDLATLRRWSIVFYAMIQGDAVARLVVGAAPVSKTEIDAYIDLAVGWLLDRASIPDGVVT